jgi:hypothetical protein
MIGVYRFYGNWSTESFGKEESKKWVVGAPTNKRFHISRGLRITIRNVV